MEVSYSFLAIKEIPSKIQIETYAERKINKLLDNINKKYLTLSFFLFFKNTLSYD